MSELIAYIRVSQVGDRDLGSERFQTVEQQRATTTTAAELADHVVVDEVVDLNSSGGKMTRPKLQEVIRRVNAGEADGVVVYDLSRWGRTLRALEPIEQWAAEGKVFISAKDSFNASTPEGRVALRMMMVIASYYWEQSKARWADSQADAIRRGIHVGPTPIGYLRDDDGRLLIDAVKGPLVQECYRRAATSHAKAAAFAAKHLNVNSSNLRVMLARRVYRGEIHHESHEPNLSAHEPLVEERTWEAAQSKPKFRAPIGAYPLSGILRCACGSAMSGQKVSPERRRYRCSRLEPEKGPHSIVNATLIEEAMRETIRAGIGQAKLRLGTNAPDLAALEAVVEDAASELKKFGSDTRARTVLGDDAWYEGMESRRAELDEARARYQEGLRSASAVVTLPAADELDDDAQLRRALEAMVEAIDVAPGRRPIAERVHVRWIFDDGHNGAGVLDA